MTSTQNMQGFTSEARNSSRVLKAPGGPSSNIFGTEPVPPTTSTRPLAVVPPYASNSTDDHQANPKATAAGDVRGQNATQEAVPSNPEASNPNASNPTPSNPEVSNPNPPNPEVSSLKPNPTNESSPSGFTSRRQMGMRNPITGETYNNEAPTKKTSKVTQPPGGASSIIF